MQTEVHTALNGTGYTTDYQFPQGERTFPSITFYEADNSVDTRADGSEYLTAVSYIVDLWAATPETTAAMALTVDTALAALGLSRTFSTDLYEQDTKIHHKSMRYRGVIHIAEQKIYQ